MWWATQESSFEEGEDINFRRGGASLLSPHPPPSIFRSQRHHPYQPPCVRISITKAWTGTWGTESISRTLFLQGNINEALLETNDGRRDAPASSPHPAVAPACSWEAHPAPACCQETWESSRNLFPLLHSFTATRGLALQAAGGGLGLAGGFLCYNSPPQLDSAASRS